MAEGLKATTTVIQEYPKDIAISLYAIIQVVCTESTIRFYETWQCNAHHHAYSGTVYDEIITIPASTHLWERGRLYVLLICMAK